MRTLTINFNYLSILDFCLILGILNNTNPPLLHFNREAIFLNNEYILKEIHHTLSASIGDEQEPKHIIKQADAAMYEAKRKVSSV